MKHKRQTLSKQGEDGDDKDSTASEGGKSGKMSTDKFLDDEMSKKSCQGCEMPGGPGCGPHDDVPDLGSTRGNNNNTPSATNNNTSFNSNSNGASSVASSGSFDKMITEDDSRSNEDSGVHTSPRTSSKKSTSSSTTGSISVKVENRKNSPNSERRIGLCKSSPTGSQKDVTGNGTGLLLALSDGIPSGSKSMSSRSLTPSSTPGTPAMPHQSPIGPPGVPNSTLYPQLSRSSPTTATAIASATVTIQNVANSVPPFVARGASSINHFQNQYPMAGNNVDYRADSHRSSSKLHAANTGQQFQMHHQQTGYNSVDMYNPEHPQHLMGNHQNVIVGTGSPRSGNEITQRLSGSRSSHLRQNYHHPTSQQYHNQQHYYGNYNNKNHHTTSADTYHHAGMNSQSSAYNHGYTQHGGYNNHYGYHSSGMYTGEANENLTGAHMANTAAHMTQQDPTAAAYYGNENVHPIHKGQHVDYVASGATKGSADAGYYENNMYNHINANHADPTATGYVASAAEAFPQGAPVVPNAATAIAAASAAVMTPPTSVQTEPGDNYNSFHQFYSGETPQTQPTPASGENSNSSADFNFLSNLANDFAPEYYQLS